VEGLFSGGVFQIASKFAVDKRPLATGKPVAIVETIIALALLGRAETPLGACE
jgi:hypothetical protein